jgi:tripartite-type tricarboxylate transporter receptor subunit TctC
MTSKFILAPLALALALTSSPAPAQDYFEGKTITLIVGSQPGGRRDRITRTTAKFLAKFIPGNPTILVQNIPGGKEIPSQLKIARGKPDGSIMGVVTSAATEAPYFGTPGAHYDPNKYRFIGAVGTGKNTQSLFTHIRAGFKSLEDLKSRQVVLGAHRVGHRSYLNARLTAEILGLKVRWILGYSTSELSTAMERGEIDGRSHGAASAIRDRPDWFEKREVVAHVATTLPENMPPIDHPILANTPSLMQFVKTDLHRDIIRKLNTTDKLGGALAFPPRTPESIRKLAEQALLKMGEDPKFQQVWEREVGLKPFQGVFSGAEVAAAVKLYTDWRPELLEAYLRLGYKPPK